MCKHDFYETLGVARNASQKDIKKAYYQLAKKYHPDTNKNDSDAQKKFQAVSEAYEILSDEGKRREYDSFGSGASPGSGFGQHAGQGASGFQGFHSSVDPEELFRKIFGDFNNFNQFNRSGRGGGSPFADFDFSDTNFGHGAAQEVILNLSFKDAARGCQKEVKVNVVDTCPKCLGSRSTMGTKPVRCPYCNGSGMETISTGPFVMRSTCRMCHGTRMYIKNPCEECEGKGSSVQRKTAEINVPAGVEDGQTLRMQVGNKELFITFRVAKSDYFRREGADIHTDAVISLSQAILGGSVRIQGLYEDLTIRIPAGTSSHTRMRLTGKGTKRVNSYGQGDHYIHFKIKIPSKLSTKQKALITAYAELEDDTPGTVEGIVDTTGGDKRFAARDGQEGPDEPTGFSGLIGKIKRAILG
ncbi:Mitochonrial uncharacterized protein [Halotydeus destructor]|nr:Mitochonrial uncharacterized protein [Halotydeus destructor]